jgi:hypothetical protein
MSAKNIKSGRGVSWVQNVWLNRPGLDTFQASTHNEPRDGMNVWIEGVQQVLTALAESAERSSW